MPFQLDGWPRHQPRWPCCRVEQRRARTEEIRYRATDTEIKIGNIMPIADPRSAYGIIGRTEAAYFKKINDAGGINGRKINFVLMTTATRRQGSRAGAQAVESDEVLLVFNSLGSRRLGDPEIHERQEVPQLFVATGATKWNDPKEFPWTMAGSRTTRAKPRSTQSIC